MDAMSYPAEYKITCRQGSTFTKTFTWIVDRQPVNLTGWTARMHVRESVDSETIALEATTSNGRITLGGAAGTIELDIPASVMEDVEARTYVYDLELVSNSEVTAILAGRFVVTAEVTR